MHAYHVIHFDVEAADGGLATQMIELEGNLASFNAVEALLTVNAPQGTGTGAALAVKLQGSLDGFQTEGAIQDIVSFTPASGAYSEVKAARRSGGAAPVVFGRCLRVSVTASCSSGDARMTGKLHLLFYRD